MMSKGEIAGFVPLMASPTATNLRRVFFLSEGLKKQGLRGAEKPVFRRVHVVGAGVMGGDIAAWCALRGMGVTLQDLDMERIKPALDRAKALFKKRLRSKTEVDNAVARLEADVSGKGLARADVIIEAVVENLEIKRKIFADAELRAKPDAILATNTSSIPLERIADWLANPNRLIGLHFFNPVAQLPLGRSDPLELQQRRRHRPRRELRARHRQEPGGGQVGARLPRQPRADALHARARCSGSRRAVPKEQVDAAAVAFGMPMGPIELMDTVGLDIGKSVAEELGTSVAEDSQFARLVAEKKLGRKTGQGFYQWKDGKPVKAELHGRHRSLGARPAAGAAAGRCDGGGGRGGRRRLGGPRRYRGDLRNGLRAVPRGADAGPQGREGLMAELRRVAIVGSARIPFTRAYTGYAEQGNLVDAWRGARRPGREVQPQGRADRRGDGRRGAVAQPRLQPGARGGARCRALAAYAGHERADRLRHLACRPR